MHLPFNYSRDVKFNTNFYMFISLVWSSNCILWIYIFILLKKTNCYIFSGLNLKKKTVCFVIWSIETGTQFSNLFFTSIFYWFFIVAFNLFYFRRKLFTLLIVWYFYLCKKGALSCISSTLHLHIYLCWSVLLFN